MVRIHHVRKLFLILTALISLLLPGIARGAEGDKGYVGIDVCRACHQDKYENFIKSVHGKKAIPGTPANREACETCHGPGAEHVEKGGGRGVGIFAFGRKIEAREKSSRCLSCHEESRALAFWNLSKHVSAGVSCEGCHSIHSGLEKYLKGREPSLCFGCHRDIRAQANKQAHHPIIEERIKCSDCHNPMGGFGPKMIRADSFNELCYTCHPERRGPFMWEHPPVAENCLNCHVPHGSNHTNLLARKPPTLCQSCHDVTGHPSTPYTSFNSFGGPNTSNRMIARACLNCHTNIHGSNGPSMRGSHFLR